MKDDRLRQDLAAIERLHRRDMEAVEQGRLDDLLDLVCDDVVLMPPSADFRRGREHHADGIEGWKQAYADYAAVQYELDFEEVHVLGDFAVEWGVVRGVTVYTDGRREREQHKMMRLLQRGDDGEWRVWRAIWNDLPVSADRGRDPHAPPSEA